MRLLVLSLFVVAAFSVTLKEGLTNFADFKATFNRKYAGPAEEAHRFGCFMENLKKNEILNAKDTARYGINKFADLCSTEFKAMYHTLKITERSNLTVAPVPKVVAPLDAYDWRAHGAVNAVKDQQQCGSCWAFSAVCAMEGAWVVKGHALTSFSEEELVQCATTAGDGCQGGWMDKAIQWVISNGGIDTEADYPYTSGSGVTGNCNTAKKLNKVGKFTSLLNAGSTESTYPAYLVAHGPLSIGVDAMDGWQTYTGGLKTACSGSQVDHGVAIVGYGVEGTTPYWVIRNSWGVGWGESGYIRVKRGVDCDLITYLVTTAIASA